VEEWILPFCSNCGAAVAADAVFCGQCGKKLARERKPPVAKEAQARDQTGALLSDSPELETFTRVFAWVLKTHVAALTNLTQAVAPFFNSFIVLHENQILSVASEDAMDEGTVENLLFRLPIADDGAYALEALVSVKENRPVTPKAMKALRNTTSEAIAAYLSTKRAVEALKDASRPLYQARVRFTELRRREDLKDLETLRLYEDTVDRFKTTVRAIDWTECPQEDPAPWIKVADSRPIVAKSIVDDKEFLQWPWSQGRGIGTDVERNFAVYFTMSKEVDKIFLRCRQLFERVRDATGVLRRPAKGVTEDASQALSEFNIWFGALSAPYWYLDAKLTLMEELEGGRGERILNTIDQSLTTAASRDTIQDPQPALKAVFNLISAMNEVEPVHRLLGSLQF
jgi:hypothetical protein